MMKKKCMLLFVCCLLAIPVTALAEFINIATGSTGGTYYPVGATMANIWRDNIPGAKASAQSTGGTVNNIQLLRAGEAEACICDGMYYDAYYGMGSYADRAHPFLRGIAVLYPDVVHFVVAKNSDIKTVADLKGKRVGVGPVGGSVPLLTQAILAAAGLDMRKDMRPEYLGHAETTAAFADKHIDAAIAVGSLGIASVVEMTTLGTAKVLPLDADIITTVCASAPYFTPYAIPSSSYKGQDETLSTLSIPNIVAVHEKLSPDLVYHMTRLLFEHKKDLVAVAASMESMKAENVAQIKIPLHPGAEKYYREQGILP